MRFCSLTVVLCTWQVSCSVDKYSLRQLTWVMISEYDLNFGYENKLFGSLNLVCQTAWKN